MSGIRVYRYLLQVKPDRSAWFTMIAPGHDLEAARRDARFHFGRRLLDIVEVVNEPVEEPMKEAA